MAVGTCQLICVCVCVCSVCIKFPGSILIVGHFPGKHNVCNCVVRTYDVHFTNSCLYLECFTRHGGDDIILCMKGSSRQLVNKIKY